MSGNEPENDTHEASNAASVPETDSQRAARIAARERVRLQQEAARLAAAEAAGRQEVPAVNEAPVSELDSLTATVQTMAQRQRESDEQIDTLTRLVRQLVDQPTEAQATQTAPAEPQHAVDDDAAYLQRTATVLQMPPTERVQLKMRMPAVFTGEADKVQQFVDAWDCILMTDARLSATQQIAYVAQYMEGGAFVWYKTKRLSDPSIFTSWAHFSAAMLKQFAMRQPDNVVLDHMLSVRQLSSASEYNTRFNALLLKLQTPLPPTVAIHQYTRGLKDSIQVKLAGHEHKTLDAVQQAAADIDQTLFQTQRRINARSGNTHNTVKLSEVQVDEQEVPAQANDDLMQGLKLLLNKMNTKKPRADQSKWTDEMKERYEKNQCFTCAGTDHSARFCPRKKRKQLNE